MPNNAVEEYLANMADIHATGGGVAETSYYTPLENLLNTVGDGLKPKVRCVMQLKNLGAGNPDGGLFSRDQWDRKANAPKNPQAPSRGVIEAKPVSNSVLAIADTNQVTTYWKKYGLVLVTNYREFLLVGRDPNGVPVKLESFVIGASEEEFWQLTKTPQKVGRVMQRGLEEFLRRVMLHEAQISTPEDLAGILASYARDALARVEGAELTALNSLKASLEEALGIKFEDEQGEHVFRSTLVQSLFYGAFSAWVLWARSKTNADEGKFNWHDAAWHLNVPVIQALYGQLAQPNKLEPLNLVELLDWASAALDRVDRSAFFSAFEEARAVQHFYEPFLEAFDPILRKQMGVWYTPPEIVKYMVERVDRVLRSELDITDGLADENVFVLDPATGTGSYLVEVLRRIRKTLEQKGEGALVGPSVRKAAATRVAGFEILPAPYVVAHLQVGLFLQSIGAPLGQGDYQRSAIYLTNALTGWKPLDPEKEKAFQIALSDLPQMVEERDKASEVKSKAPILVVLGNPPYNAFAGTSPIEEEGLVDPYKKGLVAEWGIKKFNLDDLYVRFFRLAERRIAEQTGRGVVCYISNFSYLSDPSFVTMRQKFLSEFDSIWVDNLNGDSRETGKKTSEGEPDPSVFSTSFNKAGIKVGTAIGLMVRGVQEDTAAVVGYREFWGPGKRTALVGTLENDDEAFEASYSATSPTSDNKYLFKAENVSKEYRAWPSLAELPTTAPFNGPIERRANSLIRFREDKEGFAVVESYLDPEISEETIAQMEPRFMRSSGEFEAGRVRTALLKAKITYKSQNIVVYPFKPFDYRLAYLDPNLAPLFSRPSPKLLAQRETKDNFFLVTRDSADKRDEGPVLLFSRHISDYDSLSGHARHIPFLVKQNVVKKPPSKTQSTFLDEIEATANTFKPNISETTKQYLLEIDPNNSCSMVDKSRWVWMHALSIGYSPAYLDENADGIKRDWSRIPLPNSLELLKVSASRGAEVADLLDLENPVVGITTGDIRKELIFVGMLSVIEGEVLPSDGLRLSAGWGHFGQRDAVMPGTGRAVAREWSPEERKSVSLGAKALGIDFDAYLNRIGETCVDVFLSENVYWAGVPKSVWEYRIGGYQVIKKWLSYREHAVLGRYLTTEEASYVQEMARRLTAIVLLQPQLDANYEQVKANTYDWPATAKKS